MTSLQVLRIDYTLGNYPQIQEKVGYDGRIPARVVGAKGKGLDYFKQRKIDIYLLKLNLKENLHFKKIWKHNLTASKPGARGTRSSTNFLF